LLTFQKVIAEEFGNKSASP